MILAIKEAFESYKNPLYCQKIILYKFTRTISYWTKLQAISFIIPFIIAVFSITFLIPQLPNYLNRTLPEGEVRIENGNFNTTIDEPYISGDSQFALIVDTSSTINLETYESAIYVQKNSILFKNTDGQITTQPFSEYPNLSFSNTQLINWATQNQFLIWCLGILLIVLLLLLFFILYLVYKLSIFVIISFFIYLLTRQIASILKFNQIFNLVVYASILPLLISAIFLFTPNRLIMSINLLIFIYFLTNWIKNIPKISQN